ncbi:hypothetical protein [Clostridium tertium]|uniref:hypothetical protein n=1 Tax=Clostridium tertium TaxID=1559 RepID=UPI0023B2F208|nr:hypothetical protein [Clostridium tertium]
MKFITHGIHTRLHYIIKSAGGINKEIRKQYLIQTYDIDEETADIVLMYPFEKLIETHTVIEIVDMIKLHEEYKKKQSIRKLNDVISALVKMKKLSNII